MWYLLFCKSLSSLCWVIQHISSLLSCLSGLVPLKKHLTEAMLVTRGLICQKSSYRLNQEYLPQGKYSFFICLKSRTPVYLIYTPVSFFIYILPMTTNPCRTPATSRITRPAWSPRRLAPIPGTATRDVHCKCRAPGSGGISCVVSCLLYEPSPLHANPPVTRG